MSETKDENIKLVESEQAETKDDEKKVETGYYLFFKIDHCHVTKYKNDRLEEITETGLENDEAANGIEANGTETVKADKESETEKACLIEPEAEVECFKKDFFEGIKCILCHIYVVHQPLLSVN